MPGSNLKGKCRFFNGVQNDTCLAGVCYESVRLKHEAKSFTGYGGRRYNLYVSIPCIPDHNLAGATCDKFDAYTPEETAEAERESEKRFANTMKARAAIVETIGPWKKGTAGTAGAIDCPVCGKEKALRFSRAGYNGHIHASCKTKGCVSWME